jgi:xanthine dehydrogenase small subunit
VLQLEVNGQQVEVPDSGDTLLGLLRDHLGLSGPKDGCSPQGQCGCCTVLVDGQPRVACVTPARRVRGRSVTTIEGLAPERQQAWGDALCATGGSQCGFCTPGIVLRLENLAAQPETTEAAVDQSLLAHLCRCTGWQTISEAFRLVADGQPVDLSGRDLEAASRRAELEGRQPQRVSPEVALGRGGFAADTAPSDSLRAIPDGSGGWVVGETLHEARVAAAKTQGRRTTAGHTWPLEVPEGQWEARLRTTWVEPGYLETDAAWSQPGGEPSSPLANGGAFGAKTSSPIGVAARELADLHNRPVLALASREDTVQWGPKRPPVAGGANADGTGHLRVVATPGVAEAIALVAPGLTVEEVEVVGPSTSVGIRGAGWTEAVVLLAGARGEVGTVTAPNGAEASADVVREPDGSISQLSVAVRCGEVLDDVVLRSYCIGAAHMAYSWVTSEALMVDDEGEVHDLTIRSFGITRAIDMPTVDVVIHPDEGEPVNGSDAVFAAVAAAVWLSSECTTEWPVGSAT